MKVEVRSTKGEVKFTFNEISPGTTVGELKKKIHANDKRLYISRQALRTIPTGKSLNDDKKLEDLCEVPGASLLCLYLRDLGPQIGWKTVFLVEYTGPLVTYFIIWLLRQPVLHLDFITPITTHENLRQLAMACWCGHYIKRLLETIFVHRFSHATMPLRNLFKNCTYYWGFSAFVSYFVNHPLYTLPAYGCIQICSGLGLFLLGEIGNLQCHLLLKNLRPPGSCVRLIPKPIPGQPLTKLFDLVACPNYTYEVIAWTGFAIMAQSLPAALFAFVGFCQMSLWALNKLRAYRREFPEYPPNMRAIVPFIL